MKKIEILDSTLRDGVQGEGVSLSVEDKIKITKVLDGFHIDYIEAGFPSSNPKDAEYFEKMKSVKLCHAKLAAFSSTVHPGQEPEDSEAIKKLIEAGTPAVVIFGKAAADQVEQVLRISLEENLSIISKTVGYLKSEGKEVIFDDSSISAFSANKIDIGKKDGFRRVSIMVDQSSQTVKISADGELCAKVTYEGDGETTKLHVYDADGNDKYQVTLYAPLYAGGSVKLVSARNCNVYIKNVAFKTF